MISFIIAILGLINSVYLTSLKLLQKDACIIGSSCQDVINSSYGMILGLPLSAYGILFFSLVSYITYQRHFNQQSSLGFELSLVSLGTIFSLYLMIIQFFVVNSFCIYCSLSACFTIALFVLAYLNFRENKLDLSVANLQPSRPILIGSSILVVILLSVIGYVKSISSAYTVEFTSNHAAKSTIQNFSVNDLNNIAGIEYTKIMMQLQSVREQAFLTYLARFDANSLGLDLNQYYKAFVQNDIKQSDRMTRTTIKKLQGNPNQFQQYLDSVKGVAKNQFRQRYQNLQKDLLTYYDASFLLNTSFKVDLTENKYGKVSIGKAGAPLDIVIFSDFLCSHCATFHANLEHLYQQYPDKFQITFRNFPLQGPISELLSKIGICAHEQNQFNAYADAIYANQKEVKFETINDYLPKGLNTNDLLSCVQDPNVSYILNQDVEEVSRLNIQATPTVFLNGYLSNINMIKAELSKLVGYDVNSSHAHSHSNNDHSGHNH